MLISGSVVGSCLHTRTTRSGVPRPQSRGRTGSFGTCSESGRPAPSGLATTRKRSRASLLSETSGKKSRLGVHFLTHFRERHMPPSPGGPLAICTHQACPCPGARASAFPSPTASCHPSGWSPSLLLALCPGRFFREGSQYPTLKRQQPPSTPFLSCFSPQPSQLSSSCLFPSSMSGAPNANTSSRRGRDLSTCLIGSPQCLTHSCSMGIN